MEDELDRKFKKKIQEHHRLAWSIGEHIKSTRPSINKPSDIELILNSLAIITASFIKAAEHDKISNEGGSLKTFVDGLTEIVGEMNKAYQQAIGIVFQ